MGGLISVIIPVYNAIDCLDDCLNTVTMQTHRELEIVLVDDGSTDGSGRLCEEWLRKDGRIRVIHKPNGGVSSARNKGLEQCQGKFIGFVDADDCIELTMYEKLMRSIGGTDMACCGYYNYPMDTLDVKIANGTRKVEPCGPKEAVSYIYERKGYFNSACNKLFTRSVVFKDDMASNDGGFIRFNENYYVGEDEVWLAEVLMGCKKISFVPEALYHWCPHVGSATRENGLSDKKMTVLETKQKAMAILPQDNKTQSLLRAVMFNDLHTYKVTAYCTKDKVNYKKLGRAIRPMKSDWVKSGRASCMNKMKVLLMEAEMALHLPVKVVQATASIRRFGILKS